MSAKHQPKFRRFVEHENFSVIDAMDKLFPAWFSGGSWNTWRVVLKAAFCLKMTEDEIAIFRTVAGGRAPPRKRVRELWIVAGRRAGKDSVASLVATYSAVFFCADLRELRPGEKAVVQCLACDRSQAQIILNYVRSYFDHVAPLRSMVTRRTATGLELQNDVCIEIGTNSYKSVRGRAFLLSILDEVAFYQDENSARPDTETYNAVKPGLATLPGSMLIGISSPYRKSGLLYTKYKKHFAQDDDTVLVIQAPSLALNPTLDPEIIEKAMEDDPAVARAEWMAEWRDDVSGFVDADVVAACVSPGVRELPPMRGYHYVAFCDPSGGRQHDAGDNPPRGRQSRGGCRSREAASFQPGRRRDRVRGDAEELWRRHGSGRPLRRRVAAGEIRGPRRPLRTLREAEDRPVPQLAPDAEREARRAVGSSAACLPALRAGTQNGAQRQGLDPSCAGRKR